MRHTLAGRYGDKPVGMGGVFVIEKGKAKIHVMVTIYNFTNLSFLVNWDLSKLSLTERTFFARVLLNYKEND